MGFASQKFLLNFFIPIVRLSYWLGRGQELRLLQMVEILANVFGGKHPTDGSDLPTASSS
jgi:hypothetical protein